MERDRIESWQRISTIDVETEAVHALRMAIVLMCEAPDDSAAREDVRALAASQGMEELLIPLLAAEARQTRDAAVIAALHDERTRALAALAEPASTLAALQAAIRQEPDRPAHRERFARACYLAGAWTHAAEALEQLAPYLPAPAAAVALRAAGRLYRNTGRNDRALVAYRALAVRQPSDVATLVLLAELINTPGSGNGAFDPPELAEPPAPLPSAAASLAFALAEPAPPAALAADEPAAEGDRLATVVGADASVDASPSLAPIELELAPTAEPADVHETETVLRRAEPLDPPETDTIALRRESAHAPAEPADLRDADTVAFGQWTLGEHARLDRAPSEPPDLEANTVALGLAGRARSEAPLEATRRSHEPAARPHRAPSEALEDTVAIPASSGPSELAVRRALSEALEDTVAVPAASGPPEVAEKPRRAPSEALEADSVTLGARALVEPAPAGDRMQTVLDSLLLDEPDLAPPPEPPAQRSKRASAGLKIFDHIDFDEVDARLAFAFGDDQGDVAPGLPARTPADFDRESASVGEVVVDVENLVELSSAPVVPVEPPPPPPRSPTLRPPSTPASTQRTPTGRSPSMPRPATPIPVSPTPDRPSMPRPAAPIPVSPTTTDPLGPPALPPTASRAPTPVPLARVSRRLGRVEKTPPIVEVARPPKPSRTPSNARTTPDPQSSAPTQRLRPQPARSPDDEAPAHISVQFDAIDDSSLDLEPVAAPPPTPPPLPAAERAAVPVEVSPAASGPNLILREASGGMVVPPEVQRMIDEAKSMVRAGNLQSAETRLRNLVRARPLETAGHLALVDLLRANKRYDDAADHLDHVLGSVPGAAKELRAALVHRYALVAAAAGAAEDAHDMLCEANELDPANLSIALALGESLFARGDFDEAASRLGALREHPDAANHARAVARGLVHAAEAETRLGHPERASASYEAALRIDPGCAPAQQALAARPSTATAKR